MEKEAFSREKAPFTNKMNLNLRKELVKSYILSTFYDAETGLFGT